MGWTYGLDYVLDYGLDSGRSTWLHILEDYSCSLQVCMVEPHLQTGMIVLLAGSCSVACVSSTCGMLIAEVLYSKIECAFSQESDFSYTQSL